MADDRDAIKSEMIERINSGGAYMFGTDWFDISFHGRWVDIYVDPDSLRYWELVYD